MSSPTVERGGPGISRTLRREDDTFGAVSKGNRPSPLFTLRSNPGTFRWFFDTTVASLLGEQEHQVWTILGSPCS